MPNLQSAVDQIRSCLGDAAACPRLLQDALRSEFDGIFANAQKPVQLFVLGDSLGAQVSAALARAKAANPALRHLTLVSASHASELHFKLVIFMWACQRRNQIQFYSKIDVSFFMVL